VRKIGSPAINREYFIELSKEIIYMFINKSLISDYLYTFILSPLLLNQMTQTANIYILNMIIIQE